mgnify:CR=1 FL=1
MLFRQNNRRKFKVKLNREIHKYQHYEINNNTLKNQRKYRVLMRREVIFSYNNSDDRQFQLF